MESRACMLISHHWRLASNQSNLNSPVFEYARSKRSYNAMSGVGQVASLSQCFGYHRLILWVITISLPMTSTLSFLSDAHTLHDGFPDLAQLLVCSW